MKNFFLSVKFKNVFALFLAIIICLTCLLLSGCEEEDFQDPDNPTQQSTFFEKYVGGFNTVFANDLTGSGGIDESQDKIAKMFETTLNGGILYFYGNGKEPTNEELTGITGFNNNAPFPDSIRMFVTAENGNGNLNPIANTDKHWNWFINPNANYPTTNILNPETSPYENINNEVKDYFINFDGNVDNINNLINKYEEEKAKPEPVNNENNSYNYIIILLGGLVAVIIIKKVRK